MAGPAQWLRLDGEASVGFLLCLLFCGPSEVAVKCWIRSAEYQELTVDAYLRNGGNNLSFQSIEH